MNIGFSSFSKSGGGFVSAGQKRKKVALLAKKKASVERLEVGFCVKRMASGSGSRE